MKSLVLWIPLLLIVNPLVLACGGTVDDGSHASALGGAGRMGGSQAATSSGGATPASGATSSGGTTSARVTAATGGYISLGGMPAVGGTLASTGVPACNAPSTLCGNACVMTGQDPNHCGACYNVCGPEQRCSQGVCGCAATDILCNGATACAKTDVNCAANAACFDPLTSNDHCGDCATQCAQYQQCVQGQCVLDCAQNNMTQCGSACIDTQNDPAINAATGNVALNCGACGQACPSDKFMCSQGTCVCKESLGTRCGDKCVDLQTNPAFCGACDNPCTTGYGCVNGACVCSATSTQCAGGCYDTTSDANHCGDCNTVCASSQACTAGKCA